MAVRRACLEDLPELMRMAKSVHFAHGAKRWVLFEDAVECWVQWFHTCIADEVGTLLYVAQNEDGKTVGFLAANMGPVFCLVGPTKVAYERLVWVDEEHRGGKFGKELIDRLCEDAKNLGCSDVYIGVTCKFPGAKKIAKLYQELGFSLEERHYIRRL